MVFWSLKPALRALRGNGGGAGELLDPGREAEERGGERESGRGAPEEARTRARGLSDCHRKQV